MPPGKTMKGLARAPKDLQWGDSAPLAGSQFGAKPALLYSLSSPNLLLRDICRLECPPRSCEHDLITDD